MSVFTLSNSPFSQSTSQILSRGGSLDQIPCPVFETDVFAIAYPWSTLGVIFVSYPDESSLSALNDGKLIKCDEIQNGIAQLPRTFLKFLTPLPDKLRHVHHTYLVIALDFVRNRFYSELRSHVTSNLYPMSCWGSKPGKHTFVR
jgi:hypothetical protein